MPAETRAPDAIIGPGGASPASAPQMASPSGIRPKLPKKSRLTTRPSKCGGTSSWSIVSQSATPKPMHTPRVSASPSASGNHGDSTSPAIAKLLITNSQ
jgi:hypothetical protein